LEENGIHKLSSNFTENDDRIIDLVKISNKYAIFSTYKDDIIFSSKNPIFCGGFIKNFNQNVYNFKIDEFVLYISYVIGPELAISSNLIFKLKDINIKLISLLPYATFALKILRIVKPKLGQTFVIIGLNPLTLLIYKLLKLAGTDIYIINLKDDTYEPKFLKNFEVITDFNSLIKKLKYKEIDCLITIANFEKIPNEVLNIKKTLNLGNLSKFDIGYNDIIYKKGIKYPYPYIRWDFRENLKYFITLIEKKKIDVEFFEFFELHVNNLDDINKKIRQLRENKLIVFNITQ